MGWKAYLADNTAIWETGNTRDAAIGALVNSCSVALDIKIIDSDDIAILNMKPTGRQFDGEPTYRFSTGGFPASGVRAIKDGWDTPQEALADAVRYIKAYEDKDRMGNMGSVLGVTIGKDSRFYGVVNTYHSNT